MADFNNNTYHIIDNLARFNAISPLAFTFPNKPGICFETISPINQPPLVSIGSYVWLTSNPNIYGILEATFQEMWDGGESYWIWYFAWTIQPGSSLYQYIVDNAATELNGSKTITITSGNSLPAHDCTCNVHTNCVCNSQSNCSCNTQSECGCNVHTNCVCHVQGTPCPCDINTQCTCHVQGELACPCNINTACSCNTQTQPTCPCNTDSVIVITSCTCNADCPCHINIGCAANPACSCNTQSCSCNTQCACNQAG